MGKQGVDSRSEGKDRNSKFSHYSYAFSSTEKRNWGIGGGRGKGREEGEGRGRVGKGGGLVRISSSAGRKTRS